MSADGGADLGIGGLRLAPLTRAHAEDICTWKYDPPYDCYDMTRIAAATLLAPDAGYHAVLSDGALVGFRCFGPDGRVPGGQYDDMALDTGGGLRPDLTGRGYGRPVIEAGLAYGRNLHRPRAFRVTVARFNLRALRVLRGLGFAQVGEFASTRDQREFVVLVRTEPCVAPQRRQS